MPELRVLVTGGRDYADRATIRRTLKHLADCYIHGFAPGEVVLVHGDCKRYKPDGTFDPDRSADALAAQEAEKLGWSVKPYPADWKRYGNAAGPIRNQEMVKDGAHYCLVFPGGDGTRHCRRLALNAHITVIDIKEESRRG